MASTNATTQKQTTTTNPNTVVPQSVITKGNAAPPSMDEYKKTAFYSNTNVAELQKQLANFNMTDAEAREQAEAQYKPSYDLEKADLENNLAQVMASRDRDIRKLNTQYDRTLNSIMAGLNARNMGRSSLVNTQGVETENARNSAIADTSYEYLLKQNEINSNIQKAGANYAQNVENRANELMQENTGQRIQLLTQIAQLQQQGYSAYTDYLSQMESMALDQQRVENERLEQANNQAKLDNERLDYQNKAYELETNRLSYQNDAAKIENEKYALENEKMKFANEKLRLDLEKQKADIDKAKLANENAKLANEKRQVDIENTKVLNDKLALENERAKAANDKIALENDKKKAANDALALQNERDRLANEKLALELEKQKAENDKLKLENERKKLENELYATSKAGKKAGATATNSIKEG